MTDNALAWWVALVGLGAFHGINPGMGWLFAVARGMQEESRQAVWRSLAPLGAGHFLAVAVAVAIVVTGGVVVTGDVLRWPIGGLLIALGLYQTVRHRHPRYRGMRVGPWGLAVWSFLMASMHGAGLMVMPLFLGSEAPVSVSHSTVPGANELAASGASLGLMGTLAHALGYLVVTGLLAVVVYEKVGVQMLRKAWINLDLIWAIALIVIGLITLTI